jgi:hypothetical protein
MNLLTGIEENVMEKIRCKDKLEKIRGRERERKRGELRALI